MQLADLKREESLLCAVLGVPVGMSPYKCIFHDDRSSPNMKVYCTNDIWFFKCYACQAVGTIIDAVKLKYKLPDFRACIKKLDELLGVKIDKTDDGRTDVLIDMDRAKRLLKLAQDTLANDFEVQECYMEKSRKIHNLDVLQKYGVGFLKDKCFKEYMKMGELRCWLFPVTNEKGDLQWIKCHRERPYPPDSPKAFAAPLGTYPPWKFEDGKCIQKPKHGSVSLFPAPELLPSSEILYLCPGELKALCMLALGFVSLSTTQGETGEIPEFLLQRIKKRFSKICLVWDFEKDKTRPGGTIYNPGRDWRDKMTAQLKAAGFVVTSFTFSEIGSGSGLAKANPVASAPEGLGLLSGDVAQRMPGVTHATAAKAQADGNSANKPILAMPRKWATPAAEIQPTYEQLKEELAEAGYIVFRGDTLKDLQDAKNMLEACQRESVTGRVVHTDWIETLEKNSQSHNRYKEVRKCDTTEAK